VLNVAGMGDATGRAESMLGRRLRPWWGQAPSKLLIGGLVRAGLFGLIIYGCWQVRYGSVDLTEIDLADGSLEDHRSTIETAAVWVAAVAALLVAYNVIQVVIGAFDLFVRRNVDGQLLAAQERRTGDFLPGIVQHFWFRSRDRSGMNRSVRRRRRYEVVIATSRGPKSWTVKLQDFSKVRSRHGARVRLRVSPLLGYVSRIAVLEAPTPAEHTGFDQYAHRR
jgi:hypothetical protein